LAGKEKNGIKIVSQERKKRDELMKSRWFLMRKQEQEGDGGAFLKSAVARKSAQEIFSQAERLEKRVQKEKGRVWLMVNGKEGKTSGERVAMPAVGKAAQMNPKGSLLARKETHRGRK